MKNLLITGSLAYDRIAVFEDQFSNHILPERVHQLNVCFTVDNMKVHYGGTGGNIAYNLNLLDENPPLLTMIGKDGQDYVDYLKGLGVNTQYIQMSKNRLTANAMIITDLKDNQVTSFYQGAQVEVEHLPLDNVEAPMDLVILAPNHVPTMGVYAEYCRQKNIKYIADPGQQITVFGQEGLRLFAGGAYILILNDYEWSLFQKMTGWSLEETLEKVDYLMVTYGNQGSHIHQSGQEMIQIPIYSAEKIIDPTGCGDAYRSGLLYGLKQGFSMEKSAHIGAWLAMRCLQFDGTQNHTVEATEFESFLESLKL